VNLTQAKAWKEKLKIWNSRNQEKFCFYLCEFLPAMSTVESSSKFNPDG